MLPQRQGQIKRGARMLGILPTEVLKCVLSLLVVKAIDVIEPFCRTFQELRCFQTLGEKRIHHAAEYYEKSCCAYG
jgi:hypothetical protein